MDTFMMSALQAIVVGVFIKVLGEIRDHVKRNADAKERSAKALRSIALTMRNLAEPSEANKRRAEDAAHDLLI